VEQLSLVFPVLAGGVYAFGCCREADILEVITSDILKYDV
jgi:hypothetical protein